MTPQGILALEQTRDRDNPYGHNELVVDPATVVAHLPQSIVAVFYMAASGVAEIAHAQRAHAIFNSDYPHRPIPLLVYTPSAIIERNHMREWRTATPTGGEGNISAGEPFVLANDTGG